MMPAVSLVWEIISLVAYFCPILLLLVGANGFFPSEHLTSWLVASEVVASMGLVAMILGLIGFIRELRIPRAAMNKSAFHVRRGIDSLNPRRESSGARDYCPTGLIFPTYRIEQGMVIPS